MFKAVLKVDNREMNVLYCHYDLIQEVDDTGRPSSITRGGRIMLTIESTDDTSMFEWMCNNFERKDGSVTFFKRDADAASKTLEFSEGYLIKYDEKFHSRNRIPFVESFTISAREIKMGFGEHVNEWV